MADWKDLKVGDLLLGVWGPIRSDDDPLVRVVAIFDDVGHAPGRPETYYVIRTLRHPAYDVRRVNHEVITGWQIGIVDDGGHRFRRTKIRSRIR